MAKSAIGAGLGFVNTITTQVMAGVKGHEEAVLGLPEETIKSLVDELVQKLVAAVEQVKKILKFVRTVSMPAVDKFVAAEAFGDNNRAGIKFWLGDNFKTNFLGKTEWNVSASELAIYTLTKSSLDAPIRAELTSELEETTLAHLYEMLKKQAHGESGDLLVNGWWNVFYIKDVNGNVWAVGARWDAGDRGWSVSAYSVADPREWSAGYRVVSRKSSGV